MKKSKHIKNLEEIIPKLDDMVIVNSPNVEYNVENGTAFGFKLYNIPEVAVQRVFLSKGTVFPEHKHDENEYCLIYKGKFELIKPNENVAILGDGKASTSRILQVGDGCFVPPNIPHICKALEDTWVMWITIPAGRGYPNGK